MKEKNILILGGAGYIGCVLSMHLQKHDYKVTVVDACWFGNHLPTGIRLIEKDIFKLQAADLEPFGTVIFLAGLSNDPMAEFSPRDNFIYNTALPSYIGFVAREAGVKRLIFASSCSVYGFTNSQAFNEDDITICNYPYGVSKLQGERSLLALADENFSVVCFRQGTVSGYSPRMRLDLAINTMFRNAIQKGNITLSNHRIWRPVLGMKDLCNAYVAAITSKLNVGEVFNISSFNATVGELAASTAEFVKKTHGINVSITDQNTQDYRNYKVNTDRAKRLLGFKPSQTVTDILNDLEENLPNFSDFGDDQFYNINMFRKMALQEPGLVSA